MKSGKVLWSLAFVLLLAAGAVWAGSSGGGGKGAAGKQAVAWSADDLKWEAMPGVEGVQVAMLWGDMKKGPYGAIVKLPADQKHPLHTHSAALKMVVLSGDFVFGPEGGPEKSYGAGSYMMVPAKLRHTSASGPNGVTMFQESQGAWDLVPVKDAAAGK